MGERGRGSSDLHSLRLRSAERITPPAEISESAKEVWDSIVNSLPANHFVESDCALLHTYCEAYVNCLIALDKLKTAKWVYKDIKGIEQRSKWIDVLKSQQTSMALLATKLMICPSSRIDDIHHNPMVKPKSKREDLING